VRRDLAAMAAQTFDVLVVGGGIAGASAAWHAQRRGLRTALVEAEDFGSGTSGATTRLAHGGLRYLEHLDLGQVREGLRERSWLLRAAPHLVQPLPFLFPVRPEQRSLRWRLRLALAAYDLLAPRGWPKRRWLDRAAALREAPALRPGAVAAAAAFHDAQVLHPERLVLEFALGAAQAGAMVANHARVTALARDGQEWRATVHDTVHDQRHELRAKAVLNATGPWVERLAGLAGSDKPLVRTTRGSHVAFPAPIAQALVLRAADGRTFFAVPWQEVTLVGTTDLDEPGDPGLARASAEEVRYLLREAGAFLDLPGEACYTTAGVRSLVRMEGVPPGAVPRGHAIVDHAAQGCAGLFSIVGGKLTTARPTGAAGAAAVARFLGQGLAPPRPAALPGAGAGRPGPLGVLGARAALAAGPALCARHATEGLVRLAAEQEQCRTLPDLMLRRTLAGHAPDLGAHCEAALAAALGRALGWDAAERAAQGEAWAREQERRRAGLHAK
jgi:glycerol-3-phosphate dehydrogenase